MNLGKNQTIRKIRNYGPDFISILSLVCLVEISRDEVLNKTLIMLHVGKDPKTIKKH